jgi:TfoX/Sxy family transcriptional regulator of competence genes
MSPTPDFSKSPPELVARFDEVAAGYPDVQRRLSFGYPCLLVGGNMVTGLHASTWFVRLGDAALEQALALEGARPLEVMPGHPMTGYAVLPPAVVDDDAAIRSWIDRALEFGAALPPKAPKTKAASKPKASKRG